jgi:excisionase family DNA binding protein
MNNSANSIIDNMLDELIALQESLKNGSISTHNIENTVAAQKVELLTIKECAELIEGLSEHTVRKLVKQGKVKSIRTGEGKNGKILVNKADLIAYFSVKDK